MRKGELKKQEILDTADQLFSRNGYEETSVQDILDVLHTSKGSFYHHYASKDQLLEAMCVRRAEASAAETRKILQGMEPGISSVNIIFSAVMPFRERRLGFLLLVLPVFSKPEGWCSSYRYCQALKASFSPLLAEQIQKCGLEGDLFCAHPDAMADLCFLLVNDLWCRICDHLLAAEDKGKPAAPGEMLEVIENYRIAVEKLLSAPYGSLELMNLTELKLLTDQIHLHWK